MSSKVISSVLYSALKNGTLLDEIGSFSREQIQPFLPVLLARAFTSTDTRPNASSDLIRRYLLEFSQCNTFLQILSTNFDEIEDELDRMSSTEKIRVPYESAKSSEKLKFIAIYLDRLCKNIGHQSSSSRLDAIFDQEAFVEEIICSMTACVLQRPSRFEVPMVVRALLHMRNAVELLTLFVCNVTDSLESVVEYLISSHFPDDDSTIVQNRNALLLKLLVIDPFLVESSVSSLLKLGVANANGLALTIICVCLRNVQFIHLLLYALLNYRSFPLFIQRSATKPPVKLLHDRITEIINDLPVDTTDGIEALSAQLLAALKVIGCIRLSSDESNAWLMFLTRTDFSDDKFITTALSTIIACPQLIPLHLGDEKEVEASIIAFLDCLKQRVSSGSSSSLQHFFILLSVHLHAGQSEQLSALVSSILSFKVTVNVRNLMALKNLFLRYAMSERDIAERASQMPVTRALSSHHQGFLPAHCITQLLSTSSFSKHSVPIQDWIGAQVMNCATPLHPVVTNLLTAYASSCFPSVEASVANKPLSENFLQELFNGELMNEEKMTSRILAFFYVLCYRSNYEKFPQKSKLSYPYSEKLEAMIPIRLMLNVVESRPEDYRAVRSSFILLIGTYYPYMLPTVDSLLLPMHDELRSKNASIKKEQLQSVSLLCEAVKAVKSNPSSAVRSIRFLQKSSLQLQVHASDVIIQALSVALDANTPKSFVSDAVVIWKRLENVIPRKLYEATIRTWTGEQLTHAMLIEQPLFLFKCDERLFENDLLFSCFLRILSFYSSASRTVLSQKLSDEKKMEREELIRSLTGAQDSTVVQILLEICGRFNNETIQQLCCGHIHQMFIADPILSKLVHFQGYPLRLIPLAVRKIPSMHICLEFVHEILALADISKRVFAIVLIAELAQQASFPYHIRCLLNKWKSSTQYKIESSYIRVDLVVDVLNTLLRVQTIDENLCLLHDVIPSLGNLMSLFPQISADIAQLLSRASALASARLALSATVLKDAICIERRIINLVRQTLSDATAKMGFVISV